MRLLVQGLPSSDFELHVCALDRDGPKGEELRRAGIPVQVIGRRWTIDPLALWRLDRFVRQLQPDEIHAWQPIARLYASAMAVRFGIPVVAIWRSFEEGRGPFERFADRYVGHVARAIVVDSTAVRDRCLAQGIAADKMADKIRVIPAGVAKASAPTATRGQILNRLQLPASSRLVGLIGRLDHNRCVKDAIWAADLLKVIRDDVHLLIFGDGSHRERLGKFCRQVEVTDKVHFMGNRSDVAEFLPHLNVCWSTRRLPGSSMAILEAMAAGVPVVATNIPGTCAIIGHEKTGFLVDPGHRAGFARWTEQLLNRPELAQTIGEAGRARATTAFSAEAMVEAWKGV